MLLWISKKVFIRSNKSDSNRVLTLMIFGWFFTLLPFSCGYDIQDGFHHKTKSNIIGLQRQIQTIP